MTDKQAAEHAHMCGKDCRRCAEHDPRDRRDHGHLSRSMCPACTPSDSPASEMVQPPELLWHWSARSNRESIEQHGLLPGSPSTDGSWKPPHVCLGDTALTALGLTHGKPPMDLWLVHRDDCTDLTRREDDKREWRTTHPILWVRLVDVEAHEGNLL